MIKILNHYLSQYTVFRYIISGGTSAFVDLSILYYLNSVVGMYYLWAAIFAFCIAFCVSFMLQKFWTFRSMSRVNMHRQMTMYLGTSLFGLGMNTLLMYIFVDHFHLMVLFSQIFAGALVACGTFFLSRKVFSTNIANLIE